MTQKSSLTATNITLIFTAIFIYMAAILVLLPSGNVQLYGFKVQLSFKQIVEIVLQICPLVMAFCSLVIFPLRDSIINYLMIKHAASLPKSINMLAAAIAVLQVHFVMAIVFAVITLIPIFLSVAQVEALSVSLSFYIALSLIYDLTLIGIFTHFLFCLLPHRWAVWPVFIFYVILVIILGPMFNITNFIGFASSSAVVMTAFSDFPLYFEEASYYRLYWGLVTLAMVYLLTVFSGQKRGILYGIITAIRVRKPGWLPKAGGFLVIALVIGSTAGFISQAEHTNPVAGTQVKETGLKPIKALTLSRYRAILNNVNLNFDFISQQRKINLDAELNFVIPLQAAALNVITLQLPQLFEVDSFAITTGQKYTVLKNQGHYYLNFDKALVPGTRFSVKYSAAVVADESFYRHKKAKVMSEGAFLSSPDFLMQSRSSFCTANISMNEDQQSTGAARCLGNENYLIADKITGNIHFIADNDLTVLTIGNHASQPFDRHRNAHRFEISQANYSIFSLTAAKLQTYTEISNGIRINIHTSMAFDQKKAVKLAQAINQMIDFYSTKLPPFDHKEVHLIEQPTHLGEAMSFDNHILFSEQILSSLTVEPEVEDKSLNQLIHFVLAHEISHHWFGYHIIPKKQPGQDFLLESFAQYLAYRYLDSQQLLSLEAAIDNERTRYCRAVTRMNRVDAPLITIENQSHLAYHKGAYVLLLLDKLLDHQLLSILNNVIHALNNSREISAAAFIQILLNKIPQDILPVAKHLLYETTLQQHGSEQVLDTLSGLDLCK